MAKRRNVRASKAALVNGLRVRSQLEAKVAQDLFDREVEFDYELPVPYDHPRIYLVDFVVRTQSGKRIFIEAKGFFPPSDRTKVQNFVASNPTLDFRLLFQDSRKRLTRAPRSITYGAWADRHGIVWAEGSAIPKEWLRG